MAPTLRGLCAGGRGEAPVSHPSSSPSPLCSDEPLRWWAGGCCSWGRQLQDGRWAGTAHPPGPRDFSGLLGACAQTEPFLPQLGSSGREGPQYPPAPAQIPGLPQREKRQARALLAQHSSPSPGYVPRTDPAPATLPATLASLRVPPQGLCTCCSLSLDRTRPPSTGLTPFLCLLKSHLMDEAS